MEAQTAKYQERIQIKGVRNSPQLTNQVRAQIEKWIERKRALLHLPEDAEFELQVERTPHTCEYQCELTVRIGHKAWSGLKTGVFSIRSTLNDTLRSMQEIPIFACKRAFQPSNTIAV